MNTLELTRKELITSQHEVVAELLSLRKALRNGTDNFSAVRNRIRELKSENQVLVKQISDTNTEIEFNNFIFSHE